MWLIHIAFACTTAFVCIQFPFIIHDIRDLTSFVRLWHILNTTNLIPCRIIIASGVVIIISEMVQYAFDIPSVMIDHMIILLHVTYMIITTCIVLTCIYVRVLLIASMIMSIELALDQMPIPHRTLNDEFDYRPCRTCERHRTPSSFYTRIHDSIYYHRWAYVFISYNATSRDSIRDIENEMHPLILSMKYRNRRPSRVNHSNGDIDEAEHTDIESTDYDHASDDDINGTNHVPLMNNANRTTVCDITDDTCTACVRYTMRMQVVIRMILCTIMLIIIGMVAPIPVYVWNAIEHSIMYAIASVPIIAVREYYYHRLRIRPT